MRTLVSRIVPLIATGMIACSAIGGELLGPELCATIMNARVVDRVNPAIEVDFILFNGTQRTIKLAERWNSWGSYQWQFRLTDSNGRPFVFSNPQNGWTINFLTLVQLEPGGVHRMRCRLMVEGGESSNDVEEFTAPAASGQWSYPVKLVGEFSAKNIQRDLWIESNWTGRISTEVVTLPEKTEPAGSAQPATKPADKAPAKDQPSTPTSKDAPR